jgi:acetyl-CoA carboxylase biotin carboxyl carrier protein
VRHALCVAREHGFAEVELTLGNDAFSARLAPESRIRVASPTGEPATSSPSSDPGLAAIRSTLVGYYREAPQPIRVGVTVAKGDVVAVIAALGLANDIEATVAGEVVEILVEPDQPVEYGQALAMVRTK